MKISSESPGILPSRVVNMSRNIADPLYPSHSRQFCSRIPTRKREKDKVERGIGQGIDWLVNRIIRASSVDFHGQ